ncbi:WSC domain-containing protein [Lasiosphaeris hirsuta]|uniref:WSC domain-containing protein n=1 Tax=Lasiosphaeris hirsuta TaxID=260670 RepID=A0AA40A840_9PEZI|nr:WSC domain-containing protein [Lasiosphaeris hirsuta]
MPSLRNSAVAVAAVVVLAGRVQPIEVELPSCLHPFQPFVYSGCFQDSGNPQALTVRTNLDRDTTMTVEKCVVSCKGNGYRYAGFVYYGVCYCGQTFNGASAIEDRCSFPCNGGKNKTCKSGGYPFASTEYGGECFCGAVIGNNTYSAPAPDCSIPCNGDATESCAAATTAKPTITTTSQIPIPTPTNICKEPTNAQRGYSPGNPVGDIDLPIVTCNDLASEHAKYPFKLY